MADSFTIDMREIAGFADRLNGMPDYLTQRVRLELQDGAQAIAAEAIQRAPANLGILRNEIGVERISDLEFEVYSRAMYSPYVEFGTRASVEIPPGLEVYASQFLGNPGTTSLSAKDAIFAWCKDKGIDESAWYAIYVTIMTKGGKAHPFFFPAVNRILPIIQNRVIAVLSGDAFK